MSGNPPYQGDSQLPYPTGEAGSQMPYPTGQRGGIHPPPYPPPYPPQQSSGQPGYSSASSSQPAYSQATQPSYPVSAYPQGRGQKHSGHPGHPPYGYPPPAAYPPAGHTDSHVFFLTPVPRMTPDVHQPTVHAVKPFNPQYDCQVLRDAMKGLGTDNINLINVLCFRSWQQRHEIERTYKQMYGKDLEKLIKSETSYNFYRVLKRLLMTPTELAVYEIYEGIVGFGTDEEVLFEIICTKTNQELADIQMAYEREYGVNLEKAISDDTYGYFRKLLVALLSCHRPSDGPVDMDQVKIDVGALYEAGEERLGTDEARFNSIMCSRSYSHLRAVFEYYKLKYKRDINEVISSEFSGDIKRGLYAIAGVVRNPAGYFANRIKASVEGPGTWDEMLIRLIVSRCDFDLAAIKVEYQRMFGTSLAQDVADDTSGFYRKALLALIGK